MMRFCMVTLAALLLVVAGTTDAAHPSRALASGPSFSPPATKGSLAAQVDRYLRPLTRTGSFGGSILIARDGEVLLSKGYGLANRKRQAPNRPSTEYRIFDLTVQFTALAILQPQERGKLTVQDTICAYLPVCPRRWRAITIHQLLTHTSGIPDFNGLPGFDVARSETPTQIMATAARRPLDFEPGWQFGYSQTNYILLGLIIERVSGQSYETFLHDNIFQPLGMTHTGLLRDGRFVPNLATGYQGIRRASPFDATTPWAAAGLYSTTRDLYTWDQALTNEKLLSKGLLDAMFTPYVSVPPETAIGYGYGWLIGELFNRPARFHGGGAPGFQSVNLWFPRDGVTIIVLSNQGDTDVGSIETRLVPILFGK
jgi:CubicO group peptidase (beta-lactamase class C family)